MIDSFGPAPAPVAPEGPKNVTLGYPLSEHGDEPLFVSVYARCAEPAPVVLCASSWARRSAAVEHGGALATVVTVVVGAVVVVDVEVVVDVVVVVAAVGLEEHDARSSEPATARAASGTDLTWARERSGRDLDITDAYQLREQPT